MRACADCRDPECGDPWANYEYKGYTILTCKKVKEIMKIEGLEGEWELVPKDGGLKEALKYAGPCETRTIVKLPEKSELDKWIDLNRYLVKEDCDTDFQRGIAVGKKLGFLHAITILGEDGSCTTPLRKYGGIK